MTGIDWTLVVVLNGGIILYAIFGMRKTESSSEWFLGGRSVPWWIVGISAFATAIDSSDLVADSGGVYRLGVSYFVTNWVGTVFGWLLLAHFIAVPMYRQRMYTNSEYLEARFGPAARVLSSLVQVQYRTMVLANISTTLFLTFNVVGGLGSEAWPAVAGVAILATTYTMLGGSRSVAITDSIQFVVMIAASLILFFTVWSAVGGWTGIEQQLAAHETTLPAQMLHVGGDLVETTDVSTSNAEEITRRLLLGGEYDASRQSIQHVTPAWLMCVSFVLVGMAYSIVNHEQTMRLFAARSMWDMKMSVALAGVLLIALTFFNLMMGVMGRAMFPQHASLPVDESLRQTADAIYPILIRDFTTIGWKGVVVAGLIAAAISTYAGICSAMSAVMTRDVYARLLAPNRDDRHYMVVGRWMTLVILLGSFAYVPFLLRKGMMLFYLDLVATFVIPLLTIYLMGVFTRVHRKSGVIGLLAGVAYGVWRLVACQLALRTGISIMPTEIMGGFIAYPVSMLVTAATMLLVSLLAGWEPRGRLLHEEVAGWTDDSQPVSAAPEPIEQSDWLPLALGIAVLLLGCGLSFVVFW